jgi:hypothetical protein
VPAGDGHRTAESAILKFQDKGLKFPLVLISPVRTFALTKGLVTEYDVFLTVGTLEDIRKRFNDLNK